VSGGCCFVISSIPFLVRRRGSSSSSVPSALNLVNTIHNSRADDKDEELRAISDPSANIGADGYYRFRLHI
jgi:hypothetical protein